MLLQSSIPNPLRKNPSPARIKNDKMPVLAI